MISSISVLIETLWNVNVQWIRSGGSQRKRFNRNIVECKYIATFPPDQRITEVLIETLWNVNSNRACIPDLTALCFNRNIVECKLLKILKKCHMEDSFNRNIVECKWH